MRKVKRWRFYCDFCSKASMRAKSMEKHETGCTKNPGRKCGICEYKDNEQVPMVQLKAVVEEHGSACIKPLREITDDCPACILAAIRQFNVGLPSAEGIWIDTAEFDFKAEMVEHWEQVNEDRANERPY